MPGQMIYQGSATTQGAYVVTNDAARSITFAAADSTNPRIDVVYIRVQDTSFSGASDDTDVFIQQGTPASSPAVPDIPTGAFALCNVTVPAGAVASSSFTYNDQRVYTTTLGGALLCTSGNRPTNPFQSQTIFETDTTKYWMWDGSAWQRLKFADFRSETVLAVNTASITLTVPTNARTVKLYVTARSDNASVFIQMQNQIGGDTGAQYRQAWSFTQNNGASSGQGGNGQTSSMCGYIPAATSASGIFGAVSMEWAGWSAPHANCLTFRWQGGYCDGATNNLYAHGVGNYAGSNSYASVKLFPAAGNFLAGSAFYLEALPDYT